MTSDLCEEFGLHPLDSRAARGLAEQLELVVRREFVRRGYGRREEDVDLGRYRREEILEGDAFYFLPVGGIGCAGALVTKPDHEVVVFGSGIGGPDAYIWAWSRRLNVSGRNDLVVEQVHDEHETDEAMRAMFPARYVVYYVRPRLSDLPVRFEGVRLSVNVLRDVESNRWFDFTIEPPSRSNPVVV